MKKIVLILIAVFALVAMSAFAQEIKFSGEVKTGVYWNESQDAGSLPVTKVALGSTDDAGNPLGGQQGRYRLNIDYVNSTGVFGMSARLQQHDFKEPQPTWSYAYGWGNFFDDNLTVAIGMLGGSPWGTGGPEMWKELENAGNGGMRVEYKPGWVPEEYGKLNVGFVLNWFDQPMEASMGLVEPTLADILMESVLGISWTHDAFLFRFAYRLDSEYDRFARMPPEAGAEGGQFIYRIEERVLKNYLPGMQIWALGHWEGVGAGDPQFYLFQNWLFAQYAPDLFTAQLRFGYDYVESRQDFYVKPSFYWNFFDKLISAGVLFGYCQDFGDGKIFEGSPFRYIELEPKVQINFTSSYIAFVYNWKREYIGYDELTMRGEDPIRQTQWMNLRFCIYY